MKKDFRFHVSDTDFQNANRRLDRLLAFLILFFLVIAGIAAAHRFHILGAGQSQTVFDSKGILTGPGTLLALLGAALAALILFVVYKKWTLVRPSNEAPKASKSDEKLKRAYSEWLVEDVLGSAPLLSGESVRIDGNFHGRRVAVDTLASANQKLERYSIEAQCGLSLRVWWLGKWLNKNQTDESGSAPAAEHATHDPQFENCCAWQSAAPIEALRFLNRNDVTGTLHRLCFISGQQNGAPDETGVAFESGRIVLTARAPQYAFMRAPATLVFLQDLAFLASAMENEAARQILSSADAQAPESGVDRFFEAPRRKRSAFMDALSCALFVVFVLVPLAAVWFGGSS